MKKDLPPGVIAAAIACVVVVICILLYKNTLSKPEYPGADAGKPAAEIGKQGGAVDMSPSKRTIPNGGKISDEQARKLNIPGVGHNASGQ